MMMRPVRRPLTVFVAATLLVLAVITAVSVGVVTAVARSQAHDDAADTADWFAHLVVAPLRTTDLDDSSDAQTRALLDRSVAGLLADGEVYRVKIWKIDGDRAQIVYSDLTPIEGVRIPISADLRRAIVTGEPVSVPVPDDDAHRNEQRSGIDTVEVYLAYRDADGRLAVAELYVATGAEGRVRGLLVRILPVVVGGPVLLALLTLPLAIRLARRYSSSEKRRRELVEESLAASDHERRRLARLLHDGPVQDLAALGMRLEAADGSGGVGEKAAAQVREQVSRLRGLLDELDLPDAPGPGVTEAVRGAVAAVPTTGQTIDVVGEVEVDVDPTVRDLVFHCVLELLRNAVEHAGGARIRVQLAQAGPDVFTVAVVDDGHGFDPDAEAPGHHGLRLVRAAVAGAGGRTTVTSGPDGTAVTLRLAATRR